MEKDQSAGKNDGTKVSAQESLQEKEEKKNNYTSVTGRPNINVISKRNEEEFKRKKKSLYAAIGITILLITGILLLVYFF